MQSFYRRAFDPGSIRTGRIKSLQGCPLEMPAACRSLRGRRSGGRHLESAISSFARPSYVRGLFLHMMAVGGRQVSIVGAASYHEDHILIERVPSLFPNFFLSELRSVTIEVVAALLSAYSGLSCPKLSSKVFNLCIRVCHLLAARGTLLHRWGLNRFHLRVRGEHASGDVFGFLLMSPPTVSSTRSWRGISS
jgi:hypothetical protein